MTFPGFHDPYEPCICGLNLKSVTLQRVPQLTKEYDTLAHALDTTRHQIPTKGVYIPDDEDQFQSEYCTCYCE
jgi:hypothetical protein